MQRELLERHAVAVVRPYFRALGLDIDRDGNVTQLAHGAIVVGRDKEGGVHASNRRGPRRPDRRGGGAAQSRVWPAAEAVEHTGAGGGPIEVARGVDLRKLSDGELEQLEELLTRASPEP